MKIGHLAMILSTSRACGSKIMGNFRIILVSFTGFEAAMKEACPGKINKKCHRCAVNKMKHCKQAVMLQNLACNDAPET